MAEPGPAVPDDAEYAPKLRQCDRHPDATRRRPHQDPPLRPRTPLPRGERLLGHQDREGCLLRENHAEVWPEIDIRSCRYDHQ